MAFRRSSHERIEEQLDAEDDLREAAALIAHQNRRANLAEDRRERLAWFVQSTSIENDPAHHVASETEPEDRRF